jgi:hypothetical protein
VSEEVMGWFVPVARTIASIRSRKISANMVVAPVVDL